MFNDRYGLTQAVLDRRKTMTRRLIPANLYNCTDFSENPPMFHDSNFDWHTLTKAACAFKVGEIVAVAQCYASIVDELEDPKNFVCMEHWESASPKRAHYCSFLHHPGMTNKMFVSADEMPHQIRITNVRVEKLQDISDEDCIAEGIYKDDGKTYFNGYAFQITRDQYGNMLSKQWFRTPREAYAALIDRISGMGTWESNPFVFVYEFELVK